MHHAFPSTYSLPIGAKLDQWPLGIKDRIRFLTKYKISRSVWARFLYGFHFSGYLVISSRGLSIIYQQIRRLHCGIQSHMFQNSLVPISVNPCRWQWLTFGKLIFTTASVTITLIAFQHLPHFSQAILFKLSEVIKLPMLSTKIAYSTTLQCIV